MFFSDYSEFLEPQQEVIVFKSCKGGPFYQKTSYLASPALLQHDLVYSQFTQIISKRLLQQPYPSNYLNFNPFCPLCLQFVHSTSLFTTCFLNCQRNYLIHQVCLSKNKGYEMRNVGQLLENNISWQQCLSQAENKRYYGLDYRSFYVQICLSHPINEKNFLKINKKMSLSKEKFILSLEQKSQDQYFPNLILLPLTDLHLNILIQQIGNKDNRSKSTSYLSLRHLKSAKKVLVKSRQFSMEVQVVENIDEKNKLVQIMNYKYVYPLDLPVPLLRIHKFMINLPEQFEQSEGEDFLIGSRSTIVEELLNQRQTPSVSTCKTQDAVAKHKLSLLFDSDGSYVPSGEVQSINLAKLVSTNSLVDFVKNNIQSRIFQTYLSQCSSSDIQLIIAHSKPSMAELIMHEYGNYMMQKLFSVCSPFQRLQILQTIAPQLAELVKNKQGTHTIQAFIDYFTTNQEFQVITMQIRQQYYDLCRNSNSTHFIQKIVKRFPVSFMLPFFQYTTQNLLAFALDKNAMCVIKHMMRRLREIQASLQEHNQVIDMIRRQLIVNVTFNVDRLITDSFGNYVIQFCYELYDIQKCCAITQTIISKFAYYCLGKFSSNVLLKCICCYWADKRIYSSLKQIASSQIVQIFRSKDGNKILLEIMQRLEGSDIWDRLYSILIQLEPTRFYHDRWGVCLGSRSGQVGTRATYCPELRRRQYTRKPNYISDSIH